MTFDSRDSCRKAMAGPSPRLILGQTWDCASASGGDASHDIRQLAVAIVKRWRDRRLSADSGKALARVEEMQVMTFDSRGSYRKAMAGPSPRLFQARLWREWRRCKS